MAERMVLVCDVCGQPASQTVTVKAGTRMYVKDFCEQHLAELLDGARRPKRGRKPGTKATTAGTRTAKSTARKPPARRARRTTADKEPVAAA
jgi:topoisomerase IA-like protein